MNYYICQEWPMTKDNHAGMVHLGLKLCELDPVNNRLIIVPHIKFPFALWFFYNFVYLFYGFKILFLVNSSDKIFLMEYLLPNRNQFIISFLLKLFYPNIFISGLAHLTPIDLDKFYPDNYKLKFHVSRIDILLTLGSSLSKYLINRLIEPKKVITTFHYVDDSYYYSPLTLMPMDQFKVIIIGSMKRNFSLIFDIINNNPDIDFIFCAGRSKSYVTSNLYNTTNVKIFGYLNEDELRNLMLISHVSLNVMDDTIGSNVITSSLSTGLAIVASNVGSISDYCNDSNSILCSNNIESFSKAIQLLKSNSELLLRMRKNSIISSSKFSIPNFYNFINELKYNG